jgi:hypothetical protein
VLVAAALFLRVGLIYAERQESGREMNRYEEAELPEPDQPLMKLLEVQSLLDPSPRMVLQKAWPERRGRSQRRGDINGSHH